jgi:FKBP-type peptidyl-prolyl cis-trans isomerase
MYKIVFIFCFLFLFSCGDKKSPNTDSGNESYNNLYADVIKKYDNTFTSEPKEVLDRFMYVNGYRMSQNMQRDSINLSLETFIQGFVDGLKEKDYKIPVDSMDAVMEEFGKFMKVRMEDLQKRREIEASVLAVKNLSEADSFLVANEKQPGVVTLPSRLQYKILKEGNGKIPSLNDAVLVHMTSSFADGTIFDDTRGGQPRAIPNERMIPGWLESITKMKEGSRWVIYMHPTLGFGESGMEGKVPPNKLTIVDVELIRIMTPEEVAEFMKKNPPKPVLPGGPIKGF